MSELAWNGLTVEDVAGFKVTPGALPRSNSGVVRSTYTRPVGQRAHAPFSGEGDVGPAMAPGAAVPSATQVTNVHHTPTPSAVGAVMQKLADEGRGAPSSQRSVLEGAQEWRNWFESAEVGMLSSTKSLALHSAAVEGMPLVVGELLRRGEDSQACDTCGRTPLTLAAFCGQAECVETLLEHGISVDATDAYRRAAIHMAAVAGSVSMIKLLVHHGADTTLQAEHFVTAAMLAAGGGWSEALDVLLSVGSDHISNKEYIMQQVDSARMNALMWACRAGANGASSVQVLLDHGTAKNRTDYRGRSALGWAAISGHESTVRRLCDAGADVVQEEWAGGIPGCVPVLLAAFCGHSECLQVLLEYGGDPTARCYDGRCVLTALALGLQQSRDDKASRDNFVNCVRIFVPALLQAMPSQKALESWMTASGVSADEITQLLGDARTSMRDRSSCPSPKLDDMLLRRMQRLLEQADVTAWAARRLRPLLTRTHAVILIQKHARKFVAKRNIMAKHLAAARIQRMIKRRSRSAKILGFYGQHEPVEHYFRRIGERRGIDVTVQTTDLKMTVKHWAAIGTMAVQRALWRWQRNVRGSILQRRREEYHRVVKERNQVKSTSKQIRSAGMKLRHSVVLRHEADQMDKIKLELLEDQLKNQIGQIYDLQNIGQIITNCRQSLNNAYQDAELKQRKKTQTLMQYAGVDIMDNGVHLEKKIVPDDTVQDFTKMEVDALKSSDPSIIERAVLDSEAQIARGQQLVGDGQFSDARDAFETGYKLSSKALVLTKLLGTDLSKPSHTDFSVGSIDADARYEHRAAENSDADAVHSDDHNKSVARLWKTAGTCESINSILDDATTPQKSLQKGSDLAMRKGLTDELVHLRSTAAHLQMLSAFEFRRSAKELVDTALASSKKVDQMRSKISAVRSACMKEDDTTPTKAPRLKSSTDEERGYGTDEATVLLHGLPAREEIENMNDGVHTVSKLVRELMSSYFGVVLAVTIRQRAMSKSWALISFAHPTAADRLLQLVSQGLMLTWPPNANNGTLLMFSKLQHDKAYSSTGAFGRTWTNHKSAVRTALIAMRAFGERADIARSGVARDWYIERAEVKALQDQYAAELEDLSRMELNIRQAMLAEHEARIEATKITPEQVFYYMSFLRQVPFFSDANMSDDYFKSLVLQMDITSYSEGAIIIQEGTLATDCFVLLEGIAFATKEGMALRVQYEEGGFFGELGLMLNEQRSASIAAKTACKCIRVSKRVFRSIVLSGAADAHKALQSRHALYLTRTLSKNGTVLVDEDEVDEHGEMLDDEDPGAFVTCVSVAAVKVGVERTKPGISSDELNKFLHEGIWGLSDEHHTEKMRWSRKMQNQKVANENGVVEYDSKAEVPLAGFMDNIRKCIAHAYGDVAANHEDEQQTLPNDWIQMTALEKVDGVRVVLPAQQLSSQSSRTVWIGGLPDAIADKAEELKKDLGWFGGIQSLSVRKKVGYCKSWALVTVVEPKSVQLMLGPESKQFKLEHVHKGYASLVFEPNKTDEKLKSTGRRRGALASVSADQAEKDANASAIIGWHGSTALASQVKKRAGTTRATASREPADYLVRKSSNVHKSSDNDSNGASRVDYSDDIESRENFSRIRTIYRNEFEEKGLEYMPGRGYYSGLSRGGNLQKTVDTPPPTGGHQRSSVIFAPQTKQSVLHGTAVVQDGRLCIVPDSMEQIESKALESGKRWVVGPSAEGWVRTSMMPDSVARNMMPDSVARQAHSIFDENEVVRTTHVHRGIASGMFQVLAAKGAANRLVGAVEAGTMRSRIASAKTGTPQPPLQPRVVSAASASSPRVQKQVAVARIAEPLSAPGWKPRPMKHMGAGWRHQNARRSNVTPRRLSSAGASPPTSPAQRPRHYGTREQETPIVFATG